MYFKYIYCNVLQYIPSLKGADLSQTDTAYYTMNVGHEQIYVRLSVLYSANQKVCNLSGGGVSLHCLQFILIPTAAADRLGQPSVCLKVWIEMN